MPLNFAKLDPKATAPTRKHASDAGVDVYANQYITIPPFTMRVVRTGITIEVPEGTVLQVWPKGRHNHLAGAGIIDAGYQGEILIKISNPSWKPLRVRCGDAIAQLVQVPVLCEPLQELPAERIHKNTSSRGKSGGIHRG